MNADRSKVIMLGGEKRSVSEDSKDGKQLNKLFRIRFLRLG